jgi:hypothetical protein
LRDFDIDQEGFDLDEQCEIQIGSDKRICDKNRSMEESVANDKLIASVDKAGAAFTIAASYCFWVNAVPVPGAAQGAAGTCLLSASSVYATAIAVLWIDYSFEMRAAEKNTPIAASLPTKNRGFVKRIDHPDETEHRTN